MKLRKIWIVGLIVLLLAAGFVFTGCERCDRGCNYYARNGVVSSEVSCGHGDCIVEQAIQRGPSTGGVSSLVTAHCGC